MKRFVLNHKILLGIIVVIAFSILRAIMTVLWKQIFGKFEFFPNASFIFFLVVFFILISVILISIFLKRLSQLSWKELGWNTINLTRSIIWGGIGFVLVYLNTIIWAAFNGGLGASPESRPFDLSRILLFGFFGFGLAAWTEETLFRGYLQPILSEKYGKIIGVFLQAMLFSLAHIGFYNNLVDFGSAFTFGIIAGIIRNKNNSIIPSFLAHGLFWMIPAFLNIPLS